MRAFILFTFIFLSYSQRNYEEVLQDQIKEIVFGSYVVHIGSCENGSSIEISLNGKSVFKSCGGDGMFMEIDSLDINNDGRLDFVFSYAFDDYSNLGIVISTKKKNKYKIVSIMDCFQKSDDCIAEPNESSNECQKDFILTDIDNDSKIDIITIATINTDNSITPTDCSIIILHKQLLEKSDLKVMNCVFNNKKRQSHSTYMKQLDR